MVELPIFFDPILTYLSNFLPPPFYSFLITFVSHTLAFATSLLSLCSSLASVHPLEWDAQTVFPPLITLLMAYLALVTLYRTTAWLLRATIWFIKWSLIIAVLAAGAGWFSGNSIHDVGERCGTILSKIGGIVFDTMNSPPETFYTSRSQPETKDPARERRPQAWDSFQRHTEWWKQRERGGSQNVDAQEMMNNIFNAAQNILKDGGWSSILASTTGQTDREGSPGRSKSTKHSANSRPGNSRSR